MARLRMCCRCTDVFQLALSISSYCTSAHCPCALRVCIKRLAADPVTGCCNNSRVYLASTVSISRCWAKEENEKNRKIAKPIVLSVVFIVYQGEFICEMRF